MIGITVKPKQWGNSVAVILPQAVVEEAGVAVGRPLQMLVQEQTAPATFEALWDTLKAKKPTSQLKEEAAGGWA